MKRALLLACVVAGSMHMVFGGVGDHPVIIESMQGRPVHVLANVVRIRFAPGVATTIEEAQRALPSDVMVIDHFAPHDRKPRPLLGIGSLPATSPAAKLQRTFAIEFAGPVIPSKMAAALKASIPQIEVAEPWYVPMPHYLPNDPRVGDQQFLEVIKALSAWDAEKGGKEIVIAISDAGIEQTHEDLHSSLWTNTNEIPNNGADDDGNGYVDDYQGCNFSAADDGTAPGSTANPTSSHGTEVAGLACATQNNGVGITGVGALSSMFPLKAGSTKATGIIYGYKSLIYAADMGFDVVNASWGVTAPFSPIDQSVIDYCISKDLAVVCSAGNDGDVYENYPAAYRGVFGVGETFTSDLMTPSSCYGVNADVMAPGRSALTTYPGNGYTSATSGTSFASPIGAGMVALVRHRHPTLSALQATEFARRCTDDISSLQTQYGTLVPGRINLQKMVDTDPMSIPSVRIIETIVRHTDGTIASRYENGDTLLFSFTLCNYLGAVTALRCNPYVARLANWDVSILDTQVAPFDLPTLGTSTIGPIRIVVHTQGPSPLIVGLRFTTDAGYEDRDLINWRRSLGGVTMQNERLAYSIFDNGQFGTTDEADRLGTGFIYDPKARIMNFQSGFVVTEHDEQVASAFLNDGHGSDFVSVKPFALPDTSTATLHAPFGADVTLHCRFPSQWGTSAVILATIKNVSTTALRDLSAGFFLDWDIGYSGRENRVRVCPEAIPESFQQMASSAEQISRTGTPIVVVCGVSTPTPAAEAEPQVAGFLYDERINNGFMDNATKILLLKSGSSVQSGVPGDVITLVGMRFTKDIAPGEERSITFVIGVGDTEEEAQRVVRETILNPTSVDADETASPLSLYPNPASDHVRIDHTDATTRIDVVDVSGTVVMTVPVRIGDRSTFLPTSNLATGTYTICAWSTGGMITHRLAICQ